MKLVKCHIDNFGRLSDFDYDFSDGLNTILKDNGWGKTTFAAFLKAMIYGLAIDSSDRKKYLDSNKKCGGNLIFSYRDKKYQISRSFDVSSSEDKTDISCKDDSSDTTFNKDNIANTIFSLDETAFDKVIFKKQNSTLIKDSIDLIKKNLNYMNEKANDAIEYNKIISSLQEQIKEYENEEKTGILNRINKEYTDKRQALDNMQSEIEKIDLVRKDIESIRKKIEELESKLNVEEEKKSNNPEYDALVKEFQEVTTKYNDLSSRFDKLVDMYNGSIIDYPTLMEIQKLSEKLETTKLLNGESEIIDK